MIKSVFSKKYLIILILTILFIISTVSASDVDNTNDEIIEDVSINNDLTNDNQYQDNIDKKPLKSSKDNVYYIDNNNVDDYIEEGYINTDKIKDGSQIVLNDTFDNFELTLIDNDITVIGAKDSLLKNSSIYVSSKAVTLKNLNIWNTDNSIEYAINIEVDNSTIENCNINVTSNNDCFGLYITGNNTLINNNTIKVTGPSDEINWDTDIARTLSVLILSSNNTITNNNISTYSSIDKKRPGTIEALSLQGILKGCKSENNLIENNNIYIEGPSYVYGINLGQNVDDNKILNNNITAIGDYFADGIQIFSTVSNAQIINNTVNCKSNNYADAIVLSKDGMSGKTQNNTISNNRLNITGNITNLIEVYNANNTTITNNVIENNANYPNAIVYNGVNCIIKNNTIIFKTGDLLKSSILIISSNNVTITENNVKGNSKYSVDLTNSTNCNVSDNLLNSSLKGDNSVNSSNKNNIIKNNKPLSIVNTTIIVNPINGKINDIVELKAKINSSENDTINQGYVIFKVDNQTLKVNNTVLKVNVINSTASINITADKSWNKDNIKIEAIYSGSGRFTSSRSNLETINISKRVANVDLIIDKTNVLGGDNVTFIALITEDKNTVNGGKVIFKINGQTIKDKNGNTVTVDVKSGKAVLSYTFDYGISAKNCTITVVYSNSIYDRLEGNNTIYINKSIPQIIINPVVTKSNTTTITGKIVEKNNSTVKFTTSIAVKINNQTFGKANVVNGIINVTIPTKFKTGVYELKIVAGENNRYLAQTLVTIIEKQ